MKMSTPCDVARCPGGGHDREQRGARMHACLWCDSLTEGQLKRSGWCAAHAAILRTWPKYQADDPSFT
jgi:hypothetical protein